MEVLYTSVVLVCGGRDLNKRIVSIRLKDILERYNIYPKRIIQGGANGADEGARIMAEECGIQIITYQANWAEYGRSAGPKRNADMIRLGTPDITIAFWDGQSRGTGDMVRKSIKAEIETIIIPCMSMIL